MSDFLVLLVHQFPMQQNGVVDFQQNVHQLRYNLLDRQQYADFQDTAFRPQLLILFQ